MNKTNIENVVSKFIEFLDTQNITIVENIKNSNNNYIKSGYTGKRIEYFILNNKRYEANTWIQLLTRLCEKLNDLHKRDFERVLSLKGIKRLYFTKNANELRNPRKISGTDIFVETNYSANRIVSVCEDMLSIFGNVDKLEIESY